jgi:hypothetical protein
MTPDFRDVDDPQLLALANQAIVEFDRVCRIANEDIRLKDKLFGLRNAVDLGETFDRLRDEDPIAAEQLLRLGIIAMTSSRMILLAQKELMRRGVIPIPNDF